MPRPRRVEPAPEASWSETNRAALRGAVPIGGGPDVAPVTPRLPAVIAHHPTFLPPYMAWARAVALDGVLPWRAQALLCLRTASLCGSEFEWAVHTRYAGARLALGADEIERIRHAGADPASGAVPAPVAPAAGREPSNWADWAPQDAALLRAADELHRDHTIGDATWAELAAHFDTAALIEIPIVVGHCAMLSLLANATGLPPA